MTNDLTISDQAAYDMQASWRGSVLQVLPAAALLLPLFYIQLPARIFLPIHVVVEILCMMLAVHAARVSARSYPEYRVLGPTLAAIVIATVVLDMLHVWYMPWNDMAPGDTAKAVHLWLASRLGFVFLIIGMPVLQKNDGVGQWVCRGLGITVSAFAVLVIVLVMAKPEILPAVELPHDRMQKLRAAVEYALAGASLLAANVFLSRARGGHECLWCIGIIFFAALCEWWLTLMFGASVMSFPLACATSTIGFMLAYFALFISRERNAAVHDIAGHERRRNHLFWMVKKRGAIGDARVLLDASIDPVFFVDMEGHIIDVGRATENVTGMSRRELLGKPLTSCFCEPDQVVDALRQVFRVGEVRDRTLAIQHKREWRTEVICSMTLYRAFGDMPQGALVVARDMTELRQYETQLLFQATCDALTALPNRLVFRERLARAMNKVDREGGAIGVMFIDLDNFKDVNDTLGHAVGDELLQTIAIHLSEDLLAGRTVARMGGDEFAVLIEHVADMQALENLAHLLRQAICKPRMLYDHEVAITCSIGITLYPNDGKDIDSVLRNADTAMYKAKEDGKNRCHHFTAEMNDRICRRVEIGNCLRHAMEGSELSLRYQPRASLAHGGIVGVEALLRWQSTTLGTVSPGEFIPIAESSGMIVQIGEWVLREACLQARQWHVQSGKEVSVAVNLSARQFRDVDIIRTISAVLDQSGLSPHLLEVEITESMLMHDVERVANTLAALKNIGIRIAVDDFGTGYSSLNYLKTFPLDYLKIDRSFINDVTHDANDEAIVRAMIAMSHSLGLAVIAEGVETAEQLAFLIAHGCDEIQGYFFSEPLPKDDALTLIMQSRKLECGAIK